IASEMDRKMTPARFNSSRNVVATLTLSNTAMFAEASTTTNCGATGGFTCDGYTATGNFDDDDFGEIVIVRAGKVYILNHDGTPMQVGGADVIIPIPVSTCAKNEGGPPTVADFDGDGKAEIGVAAANFYIVADLECLATPLPALCSDNGIRWKVANQDCSSRVTGSSVFDFDGDGKAEVVYNDETTFRVMDGTTGTVILSRPNTSHTRLEMPIVADVDNDGNAEIVFIENGYNGTSQGIRIWGDANDSWVPTRRIWNQHAYHVTNVMENGAIPMMEPPNWLQPTTSTPSGKMNNFRQNLPEFDVYAAPDLRVTLMIDKTYCPGGLGLAATVCNDGAVVVGSGIPVVFYDNGTMAEITCKDGAVKTTKSLGPGKCQTLVCEWTGAPYEPQMVDIRACVDNQGYDCAQPMTGANNECREDNNRNDATSLGCKPQG
ncbi:MAG TPA: VCBS repeat-containing protein, partial [Polyangium sp.]|nr:VCBS repeat-containing protein [Polyangium sp.]